ncbi:MAG: uroporphyrinogen decarboxylase family protein [Acidobacteriota bacterium]
MNKREVVRIALENKRPPYVPWSFRFTQEAEDMLIARFGEADLENLLHNHILELGNADDFFEVLGNHLYKDIFGVIWDRRIEKDIGRVKEPILKEPSLKNYCFPDPLDPRYFEDIPGKISLYRDRFRLYCLGFSLFERAWILRGFEALMMDMIHNPGFVHELLNAIADYNIAQVKKALNYDIDAVCFSDDWGQQQGLLMGYRHWKEFIYPVLKRIYKVVRESGRYVFIHSCGDVTELFDDLSKIGLNCFHPFQPEVMNIDKIFQIYRGRLSFWGGLSTQRTLPFGSEDEVRAETKRLLEMGSKGNYIFSPSDEVGGNIHLKNILAFVDSVQSQPGFKG